MHAVENASNKKQTHTHICTKEEDQIQNEKRKQIHMDQMGKNKRGSYRSWFCDSILSAQQERNASQRTGFVDSLSRFRLLSSPP